MSLEHTFLAGQTFEGFLQSTGDHAALWHAVSRRTMVSDEISARVEAQGGPWHLLVLAEDWCGDAVNSLPVIARLAASVSNVDLRIVSRDTHLQLMDAHLSPTGGRAIPVVILLDADFVERGWWGSRPRALQAWINGEGASLSKEARYREVRRWYVADRGTSTATEIAQLIADAAVRMPAAGAV
jgi:Thioredoxin